MTTLDRLARWRNAGFITSAQYDTIATLVRKDRFSVFLELNALLYLGVMSLIGGLVWTIHAYYARLGDTLTLMMLSGLLGLSFYYCFWRSLPYSNGEVESPDLIFDYVLYLGCLVFSVELGYIESRFELLQEAWDHYLLLSSVVFFGLAYRFDNRFVLSLALSSLAGWFGLRFSRFGLLSPDTLRVHGLIYGALVAAAGTWLHKHGIKKHFLETYLHVAANVLFIALIFGLGDDPLAWLYLAGLLSVCTAAGVLGVGFRRFAFVVYATLYGYAGISYQLLHNVSNLTVILWYLVLTGTFVVLLMLRLARRFGREE